MKKSFLLILFSSLLFSNSTPKLIVQITVDQLRGDLPTRYMKNMKDGGFKYLLKEGIWYKNAHYGYSNTETVVGHTTLATGADPSVHGMVSNVWYDRDKKRLVYNVEDSKYHILSKGAGVDGKTEVDSSQALASTDGRSPQNILVSTFSDELSMYTNGKSKIFAVSVKDRGAVTLAGHNGKAFWFSKKTGEFITSSYYYDKYPSWVKKWNDKKLASTYSNKSWSLMYDKSKYMFAEEDNMPWEAKMGNFGRVFPHPYGDAKGNYFGSYLTFSPAGDELTLDFAKTIMSSEKLGQNGVTDYLAVSFSSTDYVGHLFGPSSLEAEDNILRLDRTLANFFEYIDEHVGLKNTLIVLSADHGGPETPGYLKKFGIQAKWVDPKKWDKKPSILALKKKFGVGEKLIEKFFPPYLYLNHKLIEKKGLNLTEVQDAVAKEIMSIQGVALAVTSEAMRNNTLPNTKLYNAALRNFNKKRSGDILVLFEPHYYFNEDKGHSTIAANHGGPWKYDTFVPVVFAGWKIDNEKVYREIEPTSIAPTLSAIVGAKPPSGSRGEILKEVLDR